MITPKRPQDQRAVAAHYDELDSFYREIWGEHLHHGLWRDPRARETPAEAAEALIALVASHLFLLPGMAVCDIGCGYGATAAYLVRTYGVKVTGLTLSAVQAARADPVADIRVADWLENDFPDGSFDRAYAIESTEHMADKPRFFDQVARTLRPGGRLVVCAWLSRPRPRPWEIRHLLEPICREGRLPGLGELAEYRDYGAKAGLTCLGAEMLGRQVRRTWSICARRLLWRLVSDRRYARFLLFRGGDNRIFALTVLRLLLALRFGSMQYALLVFERPIGAGTTSRGIASFDKSSNKPIIST